MMNEFITPEESFELVQRQAKALMTADLLPAQFKNSIGNTLVALELAKRYDMPPLAVMQSLYIVHGKPAFDAKFLIAQINRRFGQIFYTIDGEGDERSCVAYVIGEGDEKLEGPAVSIEMAKSEGWYGKAGSKWKTMPELMLRYRAATFFARTNLPDLLLGLNTIDEIRDIEVDQTTGEVRSVRTRGVRGLKEKLQGGEDAPET